MKTIGKFIGGFFVLALVIALFSMVSPIILILGGLGIWYYTKKEPNPKKMKASVVAAVVGLFGCFILLGSDNEDASSETTTPTETEQVAASSEKTEQEIAAEKAESESIAAEEAAEAAEEKAAAEAASIAAAEEKAAEEAAARAALEAEAAALKDPNSYRWDVSYDNLARTPDDFVGQKVAMTGRVIQVMEGSGTTQLRIAVNDDYDTVIFVEYDSSIAPVRILEDDYVNVYGDSYGLYTYSSTMGGEITIPALLVNIIQLN